MKPSNAEKVIFTKDGIVPDIILNPHAFPSRKTLGQFVECVLCKSCTELGLSGIDATPFQNVTEKDVCDILDKTEFERHGNELMYNGMNGDIMESHIFFGPTYYSRFKQMVKDKIHSRDKGINAYLTRQPAHGRSRGGGLRIGEMERDSIIAHGTSVFLKESMLERSDKYSVYISKSNGLISTINPKENIWEDQGNPDNNEFSKIVLPYSMKLFIQELESMSIAPRFMIE